MTTSPKQEEDFTITCVRCEKEFEGFAPEQAAGCAADVHDTMIVGHYGSAIADLTQFHFQSGKRPDDLEEGQICDCCIADLIENGTLLKEGTSNVGTLMTSLPSGLTLLETFVEEYDEDEDLIDEP